MTARDILARNLAWTREHAGTTWLDFIRTHADTKSINVATHAQNDEDINGTPNSIRND